MPAKIKDSALADFFGELQGRIAGELRSDRFSRVLYSTDASIYQVMPLGVLIPKNVDDVQAAVELAASHGIPILPRTSGSSLAGQAVNEALVIDMTRHLDAILEVNREERWARVQPGVVLDHLNAHLQPLGLKFGPDPASSNRAAMGGIAGNNATGSHSILYGMTADHVLETRVLLSDGSFATFSAIEPAALEHARKRPGLEGAIYRRISDLSRDHADTIRDGTPRHWRRCGGYNLDRFIDGVSHKVPQDPRFNLAKLIVGSEGTLAVMTEIKVNLVPQPRHAALAIVQFETLHEALTAAPIILETSPSAVELLDNMGLTLCREVPTYARLLKTFLDGSPHCILITEFYGESPAELRAKVESLQKHLRRQRIGCTVVPIFEPERQQNVWAVRKAALGLVMSIRSDFKPIPFIEDTAVPVPHLAEYVAKIEQFCRELGTKIIYYAHASAGCLHIRPLMNLKEPHEVAKLPQIGQFVMELLGSYDGVLSSEHGDGRARSWLTKAFFGAELYSLFREVKTTFDAKNLLNPGIIVDSQDITENLRFGAGYQQAQSPARLDFRGDGGFQRAVEMCNGAAVCRKLNTGAMCPSFMATRDEMHSTRGRANALRAALSGQIDLAELTGKKMFEIMELCVECKACKAECPSSVDMAKLKFEFLALYYEQHRVPLRTWLLAHSHLLYRLGSGVLAPLFNRGSRNRPLRWLFEKALGITRERSISPFARQSFVHWFHRRGAQGTQGKGRPGVVLFHDTFTNYSDVEVAIAAVEFLEAAGFAVQLSGHGCCGRPLISKGLLEPARAAARRTVAALAPFAKNGLPIIGLEPSCLLTLRDEYLYLLPESDEARLVAEHCVLFEEFVADLASRGELNVTFAADEATVLLHGHCHQKALVGTEPGRDILQLPANYRVQEIDSACCGMAGAFGYEAEHLQVSLTMGELRLFPAIRQAKPGTLVAASGFSCRSQIQHGTGREALHPAQILRRAMLPPES